MALLLFVVILCFLYDYFSALSAYLEFFALALKDEFRLSQHLKLVLQVPHRNEAVKGLTGIGVFFGGELPEPLRGRLDETTRNPARARRRRASVCSTEWWAAPRPATLPAQPLGRISHVPNASSPRPPTRAQSRGIGRAPTKPKVSTRTATTIWPAIIVDKPAATPILGRA